jgi:hypothetical protein
LPGDSRRATGIHEEEVFFNQKGIEKTFLEFSKKKLPAGGSHPLGAAVKANRAGCA